MQPWSMKRRLIRSLLALIGALWIAGVVGAAIAVRHEINEVFDGALRETTGQVIPIALREYEIKKSGNEPVIAPRAAPLQFGRGHVHYQLRARDGTVLVRSDDAPDAGLPAKLKSGFETGSDFRYYSRYLKPQRLWIQVAQKIEERREAVVGMWIALASPLLALLPIAAFLVWRSVDKATEPVIAASRELGQRSGHHLEPLQRSGLPDEMIPVIDAVNTLMERLKAALEQERAFAANAAHELRNPIASARAQIEVLADKLEGTAEKPRAKNIASSLGELGRRIEKLLQMSRAEAGLGQTRERTELAAVVDLLVDEYVRRPDVGHRMRLTAGEAEAGSGWVLMDQDAIAIVLRNALENAVTHGNEREPIDIVLSNHCVRILNSCAPIAPDVLAGLKGRFRRGRHSKDVGPGAGLGLSIVETLMRQAGGSVDLLSPAAGRPDGFEIVLSFLAEETPAIVSRDQSQ
jgi:two-component system OmpR family sensor kinase